MADIPVTPPVSAPPPVAPAATALAVIEASVNNLPDKLQTLARQLELSGTLTKPPTADAIILNTIAGQLTFMLPHMVTAEKNKLLQQLTAIFQNHKPLTVIIPPGNPPAQAFLLLPPVSNAPQQPDGANTRIAQPQNSQSALPTALPPLGPNSSFTAIVLPKIPAAASFSTPIPTPPPEAPRNTAPSAPTPAPENFATTLAVDPENPAPLSGFVSAKTIPFPASPAGPGTTMPSPNAPLPPPDSAPQKTFSAPLVSVQENRLPPPPDATALPLRVFAAAPQNPPLSSGVADAAPRAIPVMDTPLSSSAAALLKPGAEVNLRVVTILPPLTANAPPPVADNQILATVTATGSGGQPILKAGDATLYVRQPADAPVGTQMLLTVDMAKTDAASLSLPDDSSAPALQQALTALLQSDPVMARQIIETRVPQPGAALAGALLFFLSAVKQGDVRNWLGGNALDTLNRGGKFTLAGKLMQEFKAMGEPVKDAVVGEWRAYPIPLQDQGQMQMINLYVHRDPQQHHRAPSQDEPEQKRAAGQVRFLIDIRMSRIGALQLDGFLQRRQLDIIVRSEHALPGGLHEELRRTYTGTLGAIDYAGSINFQTGRQNWLNFQKATSAQGGVVT